jgi:uncharacterized protein (DUF362 family)
MKISGIRLDIIKDTSDLKKSLQSIPVTDTVIIKPSWYSPHPSNYTSAKTLDLVMGSIDANFLVVEGYSLGRQDGSLTFHVDGEKVDWRWLLRHNDWDWIKEENRIENLRNQDEWFLKDHGFQKVLEKYDAEYINITEEIWSGRVLDPSIVRKKVESLYPPVRDEEFYEYMPLKLVEYQDSALLSLGRLKGYGGSYPSLSLKNLFGLVPDPLRSRWHGESDKFLDASIIDICKVYASFFRLYGLVEAIDSYTVSDPEGDVKVEWGNYRVVEGNGLVVHGTDLVELDALICGMIQVDPWDVGYIEKARKVLGDYTSEGLELIISCRDQWF